MSGTAAESGDAADVAHFGSAGALQILEEFVRKNCKAVTMNLRPTQWIGASVVNPDDDDTVTFAEAGWHDEPALPYDELYFKCTIKDKLGWHGALWEEPEVYCFYALLTYELPRPICDVMCRWGAKVSLKTSLLGGIHVHDARTIQAIGTYPRYDIDVAGHAADVVDKWPSSWNLTFWSPKFDRSLVEDGDLDLADYPSPGSDTWVSGMFNISAGQSVRVFVGIMCQLEVLGGFGRTGRNYLRVSNGNPVHGGIYVRWDPGKFTKADYK
jgi:hypothetical protein